MKINIGTPIAALMLLLGGCGGGSAASGQATPPDPSQPPPTGGGSDTDEPVLLGAACEAGAGRASALGGIWAGPQEPAGDGEMRLLVAETGEFRWISPTGWDQQIFGTFQFVDNGLASDDAIWARVDGLTWLETQFYGVNFRGEFNGPGNLALSYDAAPGFGSGGTLSFAACNSLYARGSSLNTISGTYVAGQRMLAIDGQGEIFLQDRSCTGNGKVEVIDSQFNLYRMELKVEACAGNEVYAIGRTFSGLAYLSDSGPGFTADLLEYSLTAARKEPVKFWVGQMRK